MSLPQHRFCIWLIALDKLKTKVKLHALGVISDDLCPLCATAKETTSHLFFECPFSRKCRDGIEAWVGIHFKNVTTMDFREHKLKKKQQQAVCAVYACTVYVIWRNRNTAVWEHLVPKPDHIVLQIQKETTLCFKSLDHPGV